MKRKFNHIGHNVLKFRRTRNWTQEELAAKLNLLGCHITPQDLANIETYRCAVTNAQIVFLSEALYIPVEILYDRITQK